MFIRSLVIVLALSSFAIADSEFLELPRIEKLMQMNASNSNQGITGYADFLSWQAHKPGMEYAKVFRRYRRWPLDVDLIYQINTESLDLPRENGFRTGIGYRFESGWEVSWNYTTFFTRGQGEITTTEYPDIMIIPEPDLGNQTTNTVQAAGSLNYNVHDLEVSRWLPLDENLTLRLFGGFRWAKIEHDFQVLAAGFSYDNPLTMDGYGIRLGLESQWLPFGGFKIFGRGAGSVLAGNFHSRTVGIDYSYSAFDAYLDYPSSFTQAVPVLETALGASWQYGPWELSGGYELNTWFNVDKDSNSLLLEGFFLRLAFMH